MRILKIKDTFFLVHSLGTSLFFGKILPKGHTVIALGHD